MLDLLRQVEEHARAVAAMTCEEVGVGGFVALLHPAGEPLSYATPRAPLSDEPAVIRAELAELERVFTERGLRLRFEFSLLLWPALQVELVQAGLVPDEESPLLVCTPASFRPAPGGSIEVRWVTERDELAFVGSVMRQGFEVRGGPPDSEDVEALRDGMRRGLRYALAMVDAGPAGTGCAAPRGAVTEISTISTLPTRRRAGVASAIVTFLVSEHFAAGGRLAWASTPDPAACALLQRVGFDDAGTRVSFVRP